MRTWLIVAMWVAACGGGGSKVTVIEIPDEVVAADAPTVPGGEELRFTAADGVAIVGTYWPPRDPSTTACVVFAHQLSSTRAEYVPVIERLVGRAHLYAIDLRGHGASTQGPDGAITWRAFEPADWERIEGDLRDAVAAVRARGASGRCVMVGASIGSSATLRFVASAPAPVAAVVLLSPGLNYRGLATPDAARATRAPVLIVHSQEQGALDAATALANILGDNPTPVEVIADPGTAHGMKIVAGAPAVLERVSNFIGDHL